MVRSESLLELLDIYASTIDSQADTIAELTKMLREQALELVNIKTVYGLVSPQEMDEMASYYLDK